jgi:hypothetical protein
MAGVVVVAALAVAIPAFASGHDGVAARATAGSALLCPVSTTTATSGGVLVPTATTTTNAHPSARHQGRRRGHSHHRAKPRKGQGTAMCICGPLTAEPGSATGPSGATFPCPPYRCPIPLADTPPTGATGPSGATLPCAPYRCPIPLPDIPLTGETGPSGATFPCPPYRCPMPLADTPPTGATGPSGPTLPCPPYRCPIPYVGAPNGASGTTPAILCRPPICWLSDSGRASICPWPCVFADGNTPIGPTGPTAACPPIPICPPEPASPAAATHSAMIACPELPVGAASTR